jgi:hypothetical protein
MKSPLIPEGGKEIYRFTDLQIYRLRLAAGELRTKSWAGAGSQCEDVKMWRWLARQLESVKIVYLCSRKIFN